MSSYETDNRLTDLEKNQQQIWSALNAIIEQLDALRGVNNAVVEGDDIQPKATRNGKLRHK